MAFGHKTSVISVHHFYSPYGFCSLFQSFVEGNIIGLLTTLKYHMLLFFFGA